MGSDWRRSIPRLEWCAAGMAALIMAVIAGVARVAAPPSTALASGLSEMTSRQVDRAPVLDGRMEAL